MTDLIHFPVRQRDIHSKVLANYGSHLGKDGKEVKDPLPLSAIHDQLRSIKPGDWPRRVGGRLFVVRGSDFQWLDTTSQLFAWMGAEGVIAWCKAGEMVPRDDFKAHLSTEATSHTYISRLPHFPPKPGYFYLHEPLPEDGNGAFAELLSLFNPAGRHDAILLKALFMTPFWGGPGGARPAFVITAPDDDEEGGRGVGKSILSEAVANLCGGLVDFSPHFSDVEKMKTRLLGIKGQRIVRFDNVKSNRLSNGDLEGIITAPTISGHVMYEGDGGLPNDFTYIFTFNEVSFSKDMAQRAIPIRIARPVYCGDWTRRVDALVAKRRMEIIADIKEIFDRHPAHCANTLRFADWTEQVLMRVTDDPGTIDDVQNNQKATDMDDEIITDVEGAVFYRIPTLRLNGYGTSSSLVTPDFNRHAFLIRSTMLARWAKKASNSNESIKAILKRIRGAKMPWIDPDERIHRGYSCFVWRLPGTHPEGAWHIFEEPGPHTVLENFVLFKDAPKPPSKGVMGDELGDDRF